MGVEVREEVAGALARGGAVVALESTLISHGLPRPDNLALALEAEGIVREEGAVPATVGVIGGVPRVGLGEGDLETLAYEDDIPKLSTRDLPFASAKGSHGATTVAATAFLAARAGVRIFATGGLGGVHRGARDSWDVSADLAELARTPVAVVCAGVKSILDVPATLEALETLGVPVAGFRTTRFPGFYLTNSGCPLDWSLESEEEAARAVRALGDLGTGGMLVANPLPEAEQLDPVLHEKALRSGLEGLREGGVRGKEVTPFLLSRFREETGGESLEVNKRIILNNARLAARIAAALAALEGG
ncbi:pseudouridine-5-phosphate glycosidase [Rubrobacter marinus]|uniref:Pseudouridine-5'-phosphate glycosidase n=1 Tax=Rubrobacter marinus TaxID=2653852 RepID=A0A6G8PSK6_9ACTN|nr:pseudouridine-5-phosphate glycosidase [Rubrobacter marinus]